MRTHRSWIALALLLTGCAGGMAPVEERSDAAETPAVVGPAAPESPESPATGYPATAYPAPATAIAPAAPTPAAPSPEPAPPPTYPPARAPSGALLALLEQADTQQQQGNATQALSLLERAQRIAPREPLVYLQLARLRLEMGDRQRGEQLARKGLSLTADPQMRAAFQTLLGR